MRRLFFLCMLSLFQCAKVDVSSYDELLRSLEQAEDSLVVLDLVGTFFFIENNSHNSSKNVIKTCKNDQKIIDFMQFVKQKDIDMLAISNQRFVTNVQFQNFLIADKNYINNIFFYKKKFKLARVKRSINRYSKIVVITNSEKNIALCDDMECDVICFNP